MNKYKSLAIFLLFIIIGVVFGLYLLYKAPIPDIDIGNNTGTGDTETGQNINGNNFINIWENTTGATVEYDTGDIGTNTGVNIPIPEDPREYLEYIMEDGVGGVDYIVATPTEQPKMNSKVSSENTEEMHIYIHKNRIKFDFDSKGKKGYIMFITTKEIPQSRNLFLGIDGVTVGWLDKKASLPTYSSNEYLYELEHVKYFWSGNNSNEKDLSNSPIHINAVVGQAGNKVEKIIIFFK